MLLIACKGDMAEPETGEGTGNIRLRIWNASKYNMEEVFVNTGGGEHVYGTIKKNNKSTYKRFESAYRYAFITFKVKGQSFAIQPIDYVGETPLEEGDYTYKLNISDLNATRADLEFIED